MSAILSLIPGEVWAALGAAVAVLAAYWRAYASGKKAGKNEAKAKEADAYEQHLKDIDRAANARADADRRNASGGLHDDDGHRRD